MRPQQVFLAVAAAAMGVGAYLALTAPVDAFQGAYARIMHIHVPAAWIAFLAFGVTAAGAIGWRIRRTRPWDRVAAASAELGVLFTGIALVTGSVWGGAVWGIYWDWADPRMATTALMFFVYLGYLALRRASPDPDTAAARSSLLGIIAVVQVPLVYFSVLLARTLHQPMTVRPDGAQLDPAMLAALLVNLGAFSLLYVTLLMARIRLAKLEDEQAETEPVAGARVRPPLVDPGEAGP
jgi:heme exporter protein C